MQKKQIMEELRKTLPVMWDRIRTTELTAGVVNHRSLANLMSLGRGPKDTIRMGHKKVIITREAFLEWLGNRLDFEEVE